MTSTPPAATAPHNSRQARSAVKVEMRPAWQCVYHIAARQVLYSDSVFSRYRVAVAMLLLAMGAAQLTSALQETQTWDEGIHLASGYLYLKTGHVEYTDHPPLRAVFAVPLLFLQLNAPFDRPGWQS